jgi:hypothetical protein
MKKPKESCLSFELLSILWYCARAVFKELGCIAGDNKVLASKVADCPVGLVETLNAIDAARL